MNLTDTMNTYNPALELIIAKGYELIIIDGDESFDWKAIKDDNEFVASDPLRLLSLIIIYEEKNSDWNSYKENYYDNILKEFYGE